MKQLTVEDEEKFLQLSTDAYYADFKQLQRVLDLTYEESRQIELTMDFDHIMKTWFNYGAFEDNQLISCMLSSDLTNIGNPQKFEPNEKFLKIAELGKQTKGEFFKQQFYQTHPDHRGKRITSLLLEKCHQKWKEHKFQYAYCWANHIASKVLLFSLSQQQYVYAKADKMNDQPFYFEFVGIKLYYDDNK